MGGTGSGQSVWRTARGIVEHATTLDVAWMTREGLFDAHRPGSAPMRWFWGDQTEAYVSIRLEIDVLRSLLQLHYRDAITDRTHSYPIRLLTTALPWGGRRWWFACPNRSCGRRVAKLHLTGSCAIFACRQCQNLTYRSSQQARQFDRLLDRMGADLGQTFAAARQPLRSEKLDAAHWERRQQRNSQRRKRRRAKGWK